MINSAQTDVSLLKHEFPMYLFLSTKHEFPMYLFLSNHIFYMINGAQTDVSLLKHEFPIFFPAFFHFFDWTKLWTISLIS